MKHFLTLVTIFVLSAILSACIPHVETADENAQKKQESLLAQSNSQIGMPSIVNFQEKRMMKTILELRDTTIATVTYTQDMNGKLHKLCDSVGYGLPYSTQYTNPQYLAYTGREVGTAVLPQADPNGLFSPTSSNGTWVLCLDPKDQKKTSPVFVEPNLIVSPFALE